MQGVSCRLKFTPAVIGGGRMDSDDLFFTRSRPILQLRSPSILVNPSCLRLRNDSRSWDRMSPTTSSCLTRLITFASGASPAGSSADFYRTVDSLPLELQPLEQEQEPDTPETTDYIWALLILQVISVISVGVLWYLVKLMISTGRGGLKLWSFWLIGDKRFSYIALIASRVAFLTFMLLMAGSAICVIHLMKKKNERVHS